MRRLHARARYLDKESQFPLGIVTSCFFEDIDRKCVEYEHADRRAGRERGVACMICSQRPIQLVQMFNCKTNWIKCQLLHQRQMLITARSSQRSRPVHLKARVCGEVRHDHGLRIAVTCHFRASSWLKQITCRRLLQKNFSWTFIWPRCPLRPSSAVLRVSEKMINFILFATKQQKKQTFESYEIV